MESGFQEHVLSYGHYIGNLLLNTLPTLHTDTEPGAVILRGRPIPSPIQKSGLPAKCSVKWLHCAMFVLVTSLCLTFSAVLILNLTLL